MFGVIDVAFAPVVVAELVPGPLRKVVDKFVVLMFSVAVQYLLPYGLFFLVQAH